MKNMIKYLENENDFDNEINKEFVLVDFYADWCGPCKIMGKVLEEMNLNILKVNVDNFPDIAREFKVMSIPTLIIFENGKEIKKNIGMMRKSDLESWINEN